MTKALQFAQLQQQIAVLQETVDRIIEPAPGTHRFTVRLEHPVQVDVGAAETIRLHFSIPQGDHDAGSDLLDAACFAYGVPELARYIRDFMDRPAWLMDSWERRFGEGQVVHADRE